MPSQEIVSRYSCKRKRDLVTVFAISMFFLLIIFQLYLTLIVPVQLKARNAYDFHVSKDEMASKVDDVRRKINSFKSSDHLQQGEIELVQNVTDLIAVFASENLDSLDNKQISYLKRIFGHYESIYNRWTETPPRFYINIEKIDHARLVSHIMEDAGILEQKK